MTTYTDQLLKKEVIEILESKRGIFEKKDLISSAILELKMDKKELLNHTYKNTFDVPFDNYQVIQCLKECREEFIVPEDCINNICRVFEILQIKISFEKMPDGFLAKNQFICGIPLILLVVAITLYLFVVLATPLQGSPLVFLPLFVVAPFSSFILNNLSHELKSKYKATVNFK